MIVGELEFVVFDYIDGKFRHLPLSTGVYILITELNGSEIYKIAFGNTLS